MSCCTPPPPPPPLIVLSVHMVLHLTPPSCIHYPGVFPTPHPWCHPSLPITRSSGGGVRKDAPHPAHPACPLPHLHDRGMAHSALGWFLCHCLGQHLLQVTWGRLCHLLHHSCLTLGGAFTCGYHDYTGSLPKTSFTASRRSLLIPCHMTTETLPTPRGRTFHKS